MIARRGSLLVEVSMAATLVAVAMIAVAQLLAISVCQEREAEWRRLALQEAANALELALALPWESLTKEALSEQAVAGETAQRLPEGQVQFERQSVAGPPASWRITAVVSWRNRGGNREQVALSAWRFQSQKAEP